MYIIKPQQKARITVHILYGMACYSYTTGMSALPEIYAQARGRMRILTQVPVVQVLCTTYTCVG